MVLSRLCQGSASGKPAGMGGELAFVEPDGSEGPDCDRRAGNSRARVV
jgi:hypothetical protein